MEPLTVTGRQWVLKPGDNLQAALEQAQPGDTIVLPTEVSFTGNFVLPTKVGASQGLVLIRPDKP